MLATYGCETQEGHTVRIKGQSKPRNLEAMWRLDFAVPEPEVE